MNPCETPAWLAEAGSRLLACPRVGDAARRRALVLLAAIESDALAAPEVEGTACGGCTLTWRSPAGWLAVRIDPGHPPSGAGALAGRRLLVRFGRGGAQGLRTLLAELYDGSLYQPVDVEAP